MANIDNPNPTLRRHPQYGRLLDIDQPETPLGAHDGLMRDAETGRLVGIEQVPAIPHPELGAEYPRWVTPHESHVSIRQPDSEEVEGEKKAEKSKLKKDGDSLIVPRDSVVSVPGFEHHVRRHDGAITVLVHDKDEEGRAMGEHSDDHKDVMPVDASEKAEAERIYEREMAIIKAEHREQRLVQIIKERREAAVVQAEKDLEEQKNQVEAMKNEPKKVDEPELEPQDSTDHNTILGANNPFQPTTPVKSGV